MTKVDLLIDEIKQCTTCANSLINGVNPVFSFSKKSRIAIVGQAPGLAVHKSGIPWHDKSGDRLREWLSVSKEQFYNPDIFAIVPMGFCYPGKGKSGDLPPRKECAPQWHNKIFETCTNIELIILIGGYAQKCYLEERQKKTLTEIVRSYNEYLPKYIVLPHPSPRNNIWLKKNDWFEREMIPEVQKLIGRIDYL